MTLTTSLARGVAPATPGTLHARTVTGELSAPPRPGLTLRFGRGEEPDVDLGVGVDDLGVSRQHGELSYRHGLWWLRNTGRQLVRLPRGRMMHLSTEAIPLDTGYTPLFVKGSGYREHLVELYVAGHDDPGPVSRRTAETVSPKIWALDDDERLLLVVLGQRYLLYEEDARPLTYATAAKQLAYLRPDAGWNERRIEHRIEAVRRRLDRAGFRYPLLHDKSEGRPGDNRLLHNLIKGLVESTTLVPPDLDRMEDDTAWPDSAP
ncbi:FHA domain-containing protein [Streptomyces sp. DSM 40750]|uniref:FHA domain-containing protein n=1 Tax=Streptomyces sp. DSM 40750 TaxID=2801030 RepID=UPI00214CF7DA|nr:FHA domain-containing protein [Streptomyces sp. DSM 40750]UUU19148.1 FHA domain-containing protein [Streptomyces sp. DSM 40750]UUU27508.1 FHA domain-containing protein [Streptomyces sp. DSM 40750]